MKKVLTDTVKVIVDKKSKDNGLFECVYSGGKYHSPSYSIDWDPLDAHDLLNEFLLILDIGIIPSYPIPSRPFINNFE